MSLAAFLFVCATVGVLSHPAGATQPLRIMALGDSITAGVSAGGGPADNGGYRGALATLLQKSGYRVEFVGTRNDYSSAITDRAHEGWPGYVLRSFPADPGPGQLYGTLTARAIKDDKPNVILLMAGTNDLLRLERHVPGYTIPNIETSMEMLLGQIFTLEPKVRVIVAPVVASPRVSAQTLVAFDSGLKGLVDEYQRRGDLVSIAAAMEDAVPRDAEHFPDGIHPSGSGGYADIAHVWFQAIEQVTAAPSPAPVAKL